MTEKLFGALSGLLEKLMPVVDAFANAYKETGSFKTALLEAMEAMGLEKWIEFGKEVKNTCIGHGLSKRPVPGRSPADF